ncbi:hypothetical protein F2Q69_00009853 [Brassica cretica]|uniref:Uncharacterized protein n=1 Tax=Brassica cretica TaxID=69181 RepID=A0A8S9PHM2_BRACR|nr:hypothetical protein F2Q69_00009853 [Brassica cretica]
MVEGVSKIMWIVVATVFAATAAATLVAHGQETPCYFVFGDSVFDNGNNNALNTIAKVNYLPYGIDYPEGPTGRFSNGRIIPDVIAELAGFNDTIPPFAGAPPAQANIGLNYASGGGGIREETSQNLGERINLRKQINNHQSAIINAVVPPSQLRRCLYTISIGSNDYLNNYFLQPPTPARRQYPPEEFAESLIRLYTIYLKVTELAGFNDTIPPFAGAPPAQANIGLNYASGGGGIREETSQNLGERINLRKQINNHQSAIINAVVPPSQLRRCLYTISIGSNDYLNNYFLQPPTPARRQYPPEEFAESLIRLYTIYLKQLYLLGARKVALFGIGKIGCIPRIVATLGGGVGCAEEVNQAVDLFNNKLKALVTDINKKLSSAKFTYVDLFSGNAEDFAALGITVGDRSCCTINPGEELCAQNGPVCPDRTKYIFWDNVHTTEIINTVIAIAAFNGDITSPFSISQLVN